MAAHRPHRLNRRSSSLRIKPLVLALATVFPMGMALAAGTTVADVRLPTQHSNFTPTQPGNVTVKTTVTDTAARLDVTQTANRAITQWSSFNVGSNAQVNFYMPNAGSAMLARVLPSSNAPQQILGSVSTRYVDAAGKERVGGELFLINASGWLFGRGATVNVGGLVASSLDMRNADFLNGLGSIGQADASFSWRYAGGTGASDSVGLYAADGLVQVDAGAKITTESGGRVFLFAPTVVNKGEITTPDGQTALAGGGEVYLNNPQREKLYASEVNPNVPALRGLLVEVNKGPDGASSVTNAGNILSDRGNTTLVGMAVRQSGLIRANTSSTANGSVLLAARSEVSAHTDVNDSTVLDKHATQGGSLVLDKGSRIELLADDSAGTSTAGTPFTTSRVELSGKTIDVLSGATIKAPGAIVKARAEATPAYMGGTASPTFDSKADFGAASNDEKSARITLGDKAVIDVSGTTSAQIDAAKRNFITPTLVTNNDLKDAPLQKAGPIFHKEDATFDVRQGVPMFSSTQGYKDASVVTATERLSVGGTVDLRSTGAVVTNATSQLNISGGQLNFSSVGLDPNAAAVLLTQVKDQAGNLFTLNAAPADRVYTLGPSLKVQEAAYVQGTAAGSLKVTGNQLVLAGELKASTVTGTRQLAGLDPLAARATVNVNGWLNANDRNAALVRDAVSKLTVQIGQQAAGASQDYWDRVTEGDDAAAVALLPAGSVLNPSILNGQAASVSVQTDGGLKLLAGNNLNFAPGATLSLKASGADGIQLDSSIRDAAGTITVQASDLLDNVGGLLQSSSGLQLADGQTLDVSGRFVNQALGGVAVAPVGVKGGSISLLSTAALSLGKGSVLDVSGGATWSGSSLKGEAAGTVTISAGLGANASMQGDLRAYSLSQGGTLNLTANEVLIGSNLTPSAKTLTLSPDEFSQRGFGAFNIVGYNGVTVAPQTQLKPSQKNWIANSRLTRAGTDTALSSLVRLYDKGDHLRTPTSLSLRSTLGAVTVGKGANITTDEQAKVQLQALTAIDFEGSVVNHGGTVSMKLDTQGGSLSAGRQNEGVIWLGKDSKVDVSGLAVTAVGTGKLTQGQVLDGGTVSLSVGNNAENDGGVVVISNGAQIDISGASAAYDTRVTTSSGSTVRTVLIGSAGGTLDVQASHGVVLEGQVRAKGGTDNAVAGKLNVTLNNTALNEVGLDAGKAAPRLYRISLQADAASKSNGLDFSQRASLLKDASVWGNATVSSAWLNKAGFADVSLTTGGRIDTLQTANIAATRSLNLSGRAWWVADRQALTLTAPHVSMGDALSAGSLSSGLEFNGAATAGTGAIQVAALHVDLNDHIATQGVRNLNIGLLDVNGKSPTVVELRASKKAGAQLDTQADVRINAAQVFPDTDTAYTIQADGHTVTFAGGDASIGKPMSAGGQLTVNAAKIVQGGVLRAPFGSITLNADRIDLLAGSETSVSGAGLLVPFGNMLNGSTWVYANEADTRQALLAKQITLNAGSQGQLNVADTASIDTRGGGDVYAREFVAGPGGSKDIFVGAAGGAFAVVPYAFANQSGFAVTDRSILAATDAAGKTASIVPGQQIVFGANGALPAGTYVVLPAAYASMPGAFLVKPDMAAGRVGAADLGAPTIKLDDGSASVVGRIGYAGTAYLASTGSRYIVMDNKTSGSYSQVNLTSGNAFFAAQAAKAQVVTPSLGQDGGSVRILAPVLSRLAEGVLHLGGDDLSKSARGGTLELGVRKLHVGDVSSDTTGVSEVSASALNASGAQALVLGATVGEANASGERVLNVTASDVSIDASDKAGGIKAGDVTVVATQSLTLQNGAVIEATGAGSPDAYRIEGDGASVRVSGNAQASLARVGATQTQGALSLGAGATLKSATGRVLLEGTQAVALNTSSRILANALSLGAPRLSLGQASEDASALNLGGDLLAQLNQTADLTLRSYSAIDFYKPAASGDAGTLVLGGKALKSLTLDAGTLQGHDGVSVEVQAGQVALVNTSGANAFVSRGDTDTGSLRIDAQAATGDVVIGTGLGRGTQAQPSTVGVSGFQTTTLQAQRSVITAGAGGSSVLHDDGVAGPGGLSVAGDLSIRAASLTASSGSNTALLSTGAVSIEGNGQSLKAASGLGAHLAIEGDTVSQSGVVELRSGALTLQANGLGSADVPALRLLSGSQTLLQGVSATIGGQKVDTLGGIAQLKALQGDVQMQAGATLNVSASGAAAGGRVDISATQGNVDLQGQLLGTSLSGKPGAALSIDAQSGVNLDQLANGLNEGAQGGLLNFSQQVALRSRGDEGLNLSQGQQLASARLALVSDQGDVMVQGQLKADTANGGQILLAGRGVKLDGATLSAKALSVSDNTPYSAGRIDVQASKGNIQFNQQTQVDLGAASGQGGVLALRALRSEDGKGVNMAAFDATVTGARSIQVEGVRVWDKAVNGNTGAVTTAAISTLDQTGTARGSLALKTLEADATTYVANSETIKASLSKVNKDLSSLIEVRAGEEIRSSSTTLTLNKDWNISTPMNLTVRAEGDLSLQGTISAGFTTATPAGIAKTGLAADIRLVAGADTLSAQSSATKLGTGDLILGSEGGSAAMLVRSTTGNIDLAAGRDVKLASPLAAVYTTGQQVVSSELTGWTPLPSGPVRNASANTTSVTATASNPVAGVLYTPLKVGTTTAGSFYTGGGNVTVSAGHDVLGSAETSALANNAGNWLYTTYQAGTQQTSWWTRYDKFSQGVAALGGGNVTVQAGRAVQDLSVSVAGGGFKQASTGLAKNFGAGTLSVSAGQDILGGLAVNTGDAATLSAGNRIGVSARVSEGSGLNGAALATFSGRNTVRALSDIQMAGVGSAVRAGQFLAMFKGNTAAESDLIAWHGIASKLADRSALDMQSAGGNLQIQSGDSVLNRVLLGSNTALPVTQPTASDLLVTAPTGSIAIEAVQYQQLPTDGGQFKVVAGQDLKLVGLSQRGAGEGAANDSGASQPLGLDSSTQRDPVVLVAGQGDLTLGNSAGGIVSVVRPLQAYAGRDLSVQGPLTIQHQSALDLSVLQAGRDIQLGELGSFIGITVRGPGDLLMAAGRDLNLGVGPGVVANGNSANTALPDKSAHISLMAGTQLANLDAGLAIAEGRLPQLLGGLAYLLPLTDQAQQDRVSAALAALGLSPNALDGVADTAKLARLGSLIQKALSAKAAPERTALAAQLASALQSPYAAQLVGFVAQQAGQADVSVAKALDTFAALPQARQALFMQKVLFAELRLAGRSAVNAGSDAQKAADYQRGYDAMAAMFSPAHAQLAGDISMPLTQVKNFQGGDINLLAPVGNVNGGLTSGASSDFGVVALAGGAVNAALYRNYLVNTSRVFTLGGGDLLMWSSEGNVDAGKGARTVQGAPAPVFYLDAKGTLQVDTSASIAGSGIASSNDLDVYAPHGVVDSGDAGLRSKGRASLGAGRVVCVGCSFGGTVVGLPAAAPVALPVVNAAPLPDNTKAGPTTSDAGDDKKRKRKRQIQIDFLGYGVAFVSPRNWLGVPGLSDWWAQTASTTTDTTAPAPQPQPQPLEAAAKAKPMVISLLDKLKQRWN